MLLQVERLSLVSDEGTIVPSLSFSIDRGEVVALTGKSGSGKTSIGLAILDMLPNGIRWREGNIKWYGSPEILQYPRQAAHWRGLRGRQISYIQQDVFGIFDPVLRMGQQMTMIVREIKEKHIAEIHSELHSKMTEVGIQDIKRVWNSYPHQLSGGQLQRCQICLSIVIQPALIIADEPTSAIDKINQVEILDLFKHVRDQYQIAILCITHEASVVNYLADRSISLDVSVSSHVDRQNSISGEGYEKRSILKVEHLGFKHRFGGLLVKEGAKLKGIDFILHAGQCLGIIGESGSGKSTLAQLLVGLLIPSEGNVTLHDQAIDFTDHKDIRLLRSKIQLVMQDGRGSLHPNKTIRCLLEEVVKQQEKKHAISKIDLVDVLRDVGLTEHVLDRKAHSLSGGECLRISIARALLMKPEILICDESTTSLDGPTRDSIIRLFLSLMKHQQLGLILIAHDDTIIQWIANDILVLAGGEVVEQGPAKEVLKNPKHPATKKILEAHATLSEIKHL